MNEFPGAAPPPDGVEPNLDQPQDVLKTVMNTTQWLTLLFVSIFVALRLYAKARILRSSASWDDWATYSSYVLMVGYCITALFAAKYGGGINQWEVSPGDMQKFLQSGYAATIFYAPMAMTVKLALLLIIVRVFGSVHKKTVISVYVLIGIIVLYYVSGVFIKIFICWPIPAYWQGQTQKCMDQSAIITADAIISVISDLVILMLPTPLTWSLQLSRKKRLRITGMLCAGGIATAFSVYRLILIVKEGKSQNQTMVFTKVVLSGNAEVGIGLICACLPAVNAIYGRVKGYYASNRSNSRSADGERSRGEITMTRSFQVHSSTNATKLPLEDDCELGHDQAYLTSNIQSNPHSRQTPNSSRRSESIN